MRADAVQEAVPENAKNMLLVLASSGILTPQWRVRAGLRHRARICCLLPSACAFLLLAAHATPSHRLCSPACLPAHLPSHRTSAGAACGT